MLRILLAVFFSGAASLIYQVAWTRRLASVTSATVTAQAVVLAVFMAGLGLGALASAKYARRVARPLRAYALLELLAAAVAAISIDAVTASGGLRSRLDAAGISPGVALAVQLVVVAILLLVPTTLLGASLPLVVEHAERGDASRDDSSRGRAVGLLYAFNTFGATLGCLAAGFVGIERFGLRDTARGGSALAVVAAVIALVPGLAHADAPAAHASRASERDESDDVRRIARPLLAAAALAGGIGIGAEIVWTRLVSLVVMNTVYAFTDVLAAVLFGIAIGGIVAVLVARFVATKPDPVARALRIGAGLQIVSAVLLAGVPTAITFMSSWGDAQLALARGSLSTAVLVLAVVVPAAALNASILPIVVMGARASNGARALGILYAANTIGSVAGSVAVAFVLLPLVGTGGTCAVLELGSLLLALLLMRAAITEDALRTGARWAIALALSAAACAALFFAVRIPRDIYDARVPKGARVLGFREGVASDVMVTDDDAGHRRLWINSSWVAGTGGGHRILGQLPALFVASPKRVLGIALGTGQTFAAAFANGADTLDVVEIDPGVIELSGEFFKEANGDLFDRPGVVLHHDDGRAFLRGTTRAFDLIVLEPLQAWSAGTSNLYSREFYEEARRVLAPGGVIAQWIPFYGQGLDETRAMVRAGADVFPAASLWLDDHDGILILPRDPLPLSPTTLADREKARGLAPRLWLNAVERPADFFSMLLLDPSGVSAWTRDAPLLEDDRPFLEFAAAREISEEQYRPILRSIRELGPPHALSPSLDEGDRATFDEAMRVRDAMLRMSLFDESDRADRAAALEEGMARAPESTRLRVRYRRTMSSWAAMLQARGAQRANGDGDAQLRVVVARALNHDPEFLKAAATPP